MSKVKICGIRRMADIEFLNELQPEYAGFVFAESKRKVEAEFALSLIKRLNKSIKKVGVFVDEDYKKVENIALWLGLDVLQFHGNENMEYIDYFKRFDVWKTVKVTSANSLDNIKNYSCDKFLLDNSIAGSGNTFDWELVKDKNIGDSIILAGGLDASNVQSGIMQLKPYAVDVSSGVESEGYKDFNKIKQFIKKVRDLS